MKITQFYRDVLLTLRLLQLEEGQTFAIASTEKIMYFKCHKIRYYGDNKTKTKTKEEQNERIR